MLDGAYEFRCGQAGPGAFVLLPRAVPHPYQAGAGGGRLLMLFTPGGAEACFRDPSTPMADGDLSGNALLDLARQHEIDLLDMY